MMPVILIFGIIIFVGLFSGEVLKKLGLPKITGYILGGILLNPDFFKIVPRKFVDHSSLITNISLSFITFSVGGTIIYAKIKKRGKSLLSITVFEAECAFFTVLIGFVALLFYFPSLAPGIPKVPLALLIACLASPTDPSATLAVIHEYKAKGVVTSTIMNVAAFDDVLGIVNYSFATVIATVLITHNITIQALIEKPIYMIGGSILTGIILGFIFNFLTQLWTKETEGSLIVVIFGFLFFCFGISELMHLDELMATMVMGAMVANYNFERKKIFMMLERYTEELIFVLFFTISGMKLNFSVISKSFLLIFFFVIFRTIGKLTGVYVGGKLSKASPKVSRYAWGGLIPQGGIVIGLALILSQEPSFSGFSELIMSIILGATVFHELIGPFAAKLSLLKANEISTHSS